MADGIYIGMAGAVAREAQLDSIADNLANASTPGFKAARPAFESFLAPGAEPTGKQLAAAVATGTDLRAGPMQRTGNALDATPDQGAFLAVALPSGQVAYTRDGRMTVGADGFLRVAGGAVLSKSGAPIQIPPETTPSIDRNGLVTAGGIELERIATVSLQGPVDRLGGSLLSAPAAQQVEVGLRVGEVELGNAPPLEAAVAMVSAQRNFETSMQAIETYKKMGDRQNSLGTVR